MYWPRLTQPKRARLLIATLIALCATALPTAAAPWSGNRTEFATTRFEEIWREADLAVQQGTTNRSWTWGPQPWFDYLEVYQQSPNGLRVVQYFDKARMEFVDPFSTSGPRGEVTNGLLTVELVSGRMKLGDGIGPDQNQQRDPSELNVAGEAGSSSNPGPTYASFRNIATIDNGYRDPNKRGQRVGTTFARDGQLGFRQDLANQPGTEIVAYEPVTGHNIPRIFDDFRNAGPIPAIAAFGHPITDAYWTKAQLRTEQVDVLVQLFERRTLTYTPSNPPAYRVEMGNVGQHYFQWRYPGLGSPWAAPDPEWSITYASQTSGSAFDLHLMEAPGTEPQRLLSSPVLPYSMARSWLPWTPKEPLIYGEMTTESGKRQIVTVPSMAKPIHVVRLSNNAANDYDPAISPDNQQVAFVSDRDGNPELYLAVGVKTIDDPIRLTETTGCSVARPSWLPNGSRLIYESNCVDGNWEIYMADLSYGLSGNGNITITRLISPATSQRLTSNGAQDRWPRVSPSGNQVAFFSDRDGNTEVYVMDTSGKNQKRLTYSASRDEAPVWSSDSKLVLFNSDRDGDHELFAINSFGDNLIQLTRNNVDDGYAVWGP